MPSTFETGAFVAVYVSSELSVVPTGGVFKTASHNKSMLCIFLIRSVTPSLFRRGGNTWLQLASRSLQTPLAAGALRASSHGAFEMVMPVEILQPSTLPARGNLWKRHSSRRYLLPLHPTVHEVLPYTCLILCVANMSVGMSGMGKSSSSLGYAIEMLPIMSLTVLGMSSSLISGEVSSLQSNHLFHVSTGIHVRSHANLPLDDVESYAPTGRGMRLSSPPYPLHRPIEKPVGMIVSQFDCWPAGDRSLVRRGKPL